MSEWEEDFSDEKMEMLLKAILRGADKPLTEEHLTELAMIFLSPATELLIRHAILSLIFEGNAWIDDKGRILNPLKNQIVSSHYSATTDPEVRSPLNEVVAPTLVTETKRMMCQLTSQELEQAKLAYAAGKPVSEIARLHGVKLGAVYYYASKHLWERGDWEQPQEQPISSVEKPQAMKSDESNEEVASLKRRCEQCGAITETDPCRWCHAKWNRTRTG